MPDPTCPTCLYSLAGHTPAAGPDAAPGFTCPECGGRCTVGQATFESPPVRFWRTILLCGPVPLVVLFAVAVLLVMVGTERPPPFEPVLTTLGVAALFAILPVAGLAPIAPAVLISARWRPIRSRLLVGVAVYIVAVAINAPLVAILAWLTFNLHG